jgi:hypothetical protein
MKVGLTKKAVRYQDPNKVLVYTLCMSNLNLRNMAKRNSKENGVHLPFTHDGFIEKWQEWLNYRKERRLPAYVPTGLKQTFTKLIRLSGNDPLKAIQILDESIANNWQGIFELKTITNGNTTQGFTPKPTPTGNVTTGGFGQF